MRSIVFPDVETMLRARGVPRRPDPDGSFAEDSYDFGVHWKDVRGRRYRLTWIGPRLRDPAVAGELYLVRLGSAPSGEVELLCLIPPVPPDREAAETISHLSYYEAHGRGSSGLSEAERSRLGRARESVQPDANVEAILDGWAEVCGLPRSIDWIRDRVWEAHRAGWALDPWKGVRMNGRP